MINRRFGLPLLDPKPRSFLEHPDKLVAVMDIAAAFKKSLLFCKFFFTGLPFTKVIQK